MNTFGLLFLATVHQLLAGFFGEMINGFRNVHVLPFMFRRINNSDVSVSAKREKAKLALDVLSLSRFRFAGIKLWRMEESGSFFAEAPSALASS